MARVPLAKKKRAFRMRVEGCSMAEISRTVGIHRRTLRLMEIGWTDARGVRHKGWAADVERHREEIARAELECGLELKRVRVRTYERLARRALRAIERGFPNLTLESARDAKAVLSEIRELCKLIRKELGQEGPSDPRDEAGANRG